MEKSEIDVKIEREMQAVLSAYNVPVKHPLVPLVAVLRLLDFRVRSMGESYSRVYEKSCGIDNGPHVWIELPFNFELSDKLGSRYDIEFVEQNIRERARLVDFLGEFYAGRASPIYTRLILQNMAAGGSLLNCQGGEIMGLPENSSRRKMWLEEARAEMIAFGEFLSSKID